MNTARADGLITGLVLAGGRALRMDGADKGLLMLRGQPLVAHVAARLAPQVHTMMVSANRNASTYSMYGEVVEDDSALGGWQGPLAGVAAGLARARTEWVATVACDMPFLPLDLVARLQAAVRSHAAPAAVAMIGGRPIPVCMLVPVRMAGDLAAWLTEGTDRKVAHWLARVGCIDVAFDDVAEAFANINTPADLARAAAYISQ
jgi:molybdopterin-guanine dinucleotide biosynthesis protein A